MRPRDNRKKRRTLPSHLFFSFSFGKISGNNEVGISREPTESGGDTHSDVELFGREDTEDAKSRRMGYFFTHVHHAGPLQGWDGPARQPEYMSREDFYNHVEALYKQVKLNGAEILYGVVVEEFRKNSPIVSMRKPHKHLATVATKRHMWLPIVKRSREQHGVNLNVSLKSFQGYAAQFEYIRSPSNKKPLAELDQQPYFSPGHPQGLELMSILKKGKQTQLARGFRMSGPPQTGISQSGKRPRAMSWCEVTDFVKNNAVDTAAKMWALAEKEREANQDDRLFEFCMRHGPVPQILKKIDASLSSPAAVMDPGQIRYGSKYPLDSYNYPAEIHYWMCGGNDGYFLQN